jgi:ribonuclease HII
MSVKYIIGIDEVGRGPIAGPVAVCAFLLKDEKILENQKDKNLPKLKDSKKLSKKQRELWFEYLKKQKEEGNCDYFVSFVSSENIDKFGIAKCIQKALDKSLMKITSPENLFTRSSDEGGRVARPSQKDIQDQFSSFHIFLDGGLHAPKEYENQETIIKGDELYPVISCASIIAKVTRDRIMAKYGKEYPEYGFEKHSGYGTKAHYEAIKKHGRTPIHRKTFIH